MIETAVTVTVDLSSLKGFNKLLSDESGPVTVIYKKWAIRYRSFIQQRFDGASKGDGTWPPLAPATIAGRRNNSDSILRDTGTLFAALAPVFEAPAGSINQIINNGIRVGFGGSAGHPSGVITIAEIASFHNEGSGVPKRVIIVDPPQSVLDACVSDAQKELDKLANQTQI